MRPVINPFSVNQRYQSQKQPDFSCDKPGWKFGNCVRIPQDLDDLAAGGAECAIISLLDPKFTSLGQSYFKPWFAARPS
jgi:hypothetical protein